MQQSLQARFHKVLEVREGLNQADQVVYDQRVLQLMDQARAIGEAAAANKMPLLPDPVARFTTKKIPTANDQVRSEMKVKARAARQQEKDEQARMLAAAESQGGTTITVNIGGRNRGLIHRQKVTIDIDSSSTSSEDDLTYIPDSPPPVQLLSITPARLEGEPGRGKRSKGRNLDYTKLAAGDSQAYKKVRGQQ